MKPPSHASERIPPSPVTAIFLGLCLALFTTATTHAADHCEFSLGFKTLRDLIGHDIVGECLENEHYNEIGDSNQQTTGGLMAWRKADNWTAFTDGYRTWINGPNGLVQRLNTERFEWEADYVSFTAPPSTPSPQETPLTDAAIIEAALRALRSSEGGGWLATDFLESGGTVTFDDAPFQNLPDVPEIPFAIALDLQENHIYIGTAHRGESAETLAALLAGSLVASIQFRLGGDPDSMDACYDDVQVAYHTRALLWQDFYGSNGKPNANSQEAFLNQNLQRLLSGALPVWVRSIPYFQQFCAQFGAAPAATPAPAPTPTPSPTLAPQPAPGPILRTATIEEVEDFLSLPAWHYEVMVRNAYAKEYGINPTGGYMTMMIKRVYKPYIDIMPLVYIMYTWSAYPYGTFPDTQAFVRAYAGNPRHYVGLAGQWLESDPCTWPEPAQQEMVAAEQESPGRIKAMLINSVVAPHLAEFVVPGIIDKAEWEYFEDPEAYLNQFRCAA